jgi:glycosyltransferase involved in cell wall biosynthesis
MPGNDLTIALSSAAGDPRLESTWSGTPRNLVNSLEELGVTVLSIDASLSRPVRAFCRLAQRIMGFTGYTVRGPVATLIAARRTERSCVQAGVKTILHTGTLDLSRAAQGDGLERYVFCDYTWDLWSHYAAEIRRFSPGSVQISEDFERTAFGKVRWVFPISHYVKDNLVAHYRVNPEAITVVGTGRGKIEPFQGFKDYATGPIIFVAKERFEEKGGKLLLEGFKIARRRNPSLKLVLAGKAVDPMTAGSVPNVIVAGHVPWEELQRLFETAALFAMPAYCEAWGLVYLEALACKTPLLGLARNSLPELTKNGRFGFLVDKPDPQSVGDAILTASADPKRLEQMGVDGQQFCLKTFSWKQTAGAILEGIRAGQMARRS